MEPAPDVPDLVFTANAGLRQRRASSCPATSATPSASPRREIDAAWFAERGWRVDRAARRARPRGRRRRPALHARGRADGAAVGLLVPLATPRAATELSTLLGCPVAARAARRPAAVPPRPHVLPARRPAGHRRPAGLGRLRPQGDRGAGARAAGARPTTRRCRSAPTRWWSARTIVMPAHAAAGRPPARGLGLRRWSSARSTSSSRPAAAAAA